MRPPIEYIKEHLKGELVGVEIGVFKGENAENILENLPIKKLYLIDPYIGYDNYSDSLKGFDEKTPTTSLTEAKKIAEKRLVKHKDKIIWINKKSYEARNDVPNNLDFVYIDGNHLYDYVKADIENYWPKVRKGGILGGNDYITYKGVKEAVDKFIKEEKLLMFNFKKYDWWVIK